MNDRPIDPETLLTPQFARAVIRHVTASTGYPVFDDDLTQEALLRAVKALRRGSPIEHPKAFFRKIIRDAVKDHFRRPRHEARFFDSQEYSLRPDLEEGIDRRRNLGRLRRSLSLLSTDERTVIHMFYTEGMSVRSIAETLGRSPSAVKMKLLRSRRRLRKLHSEMFSM